MGLVSGSASFVRFGVEGELPEDGRSFISDKVAAFSFRDIDDSVDEYSIGWVSVLNMFDSSFAYAPHLCGDFVTLSLRVDERKVSPAVLRKYVQKEEERYNREQQVPKLSRSKKTEIKERVRAELTAKAVPLPAVYDLVWNLAESTVLFFTTKKKAHVVLEDFFKDCFGLLLVHQIPYVTAEHILPAELEDKLAALSPELFV